MRSVRFWAASTAAAAAVAVATASSAAAQVRASENRAVFISPMGEPFRGPTAKLLLRRWFDGADANHDGRVSLIEMRSDAARVFTMLNRNGDSEIDPAELTIYETEVAPEVRVGSTVLIDRSTGEEDPSVTRGSASGTTPNLQAAQSKLIEPRKGAGRYGLLSTPNPVASADLNFNRGISADEFARAARVRFGLLDANHDGQVPFEELPPLPGRTRR